MIGLFLFLHFPYFTISWPPQLLRVLMNQTRCLPSEHLLFPSVSPALRKHFKYKKVYIKFYALPVNAIKPLEIKQQMAIKICPILVSILLLVWEGKENEPRPEMGERYKPAWSHSRHYFFFSLQHLKMCTNLILCLLQLFLSGTGQVFPWFFSIVWAVRSYLCFPNFFWHLLHQYLSDILCNILGRKDFRSSFRLEDRGHF